jgi:DNA-binding transcriptional LysR family regulator
MKRINTADLEIFVSAVEETSFSRAAERNDLVTSAVSKRIAELERRFGKALLVRHGRGVEPTPAGALLYRQAKALLRSAQLVEESIEGFDAGGLPKIRLAANPSTILQFLPVPLARYLADRDLVLLRLKDEWAQRQFYVCVRDALSMSQPVSELLDYLRDEGSAAD